MDGIRFSCYHAHMSERLQILIPENLAARLRKAAQRARTTKSEFVRDAIELALDRESPAPDPIAALGELDAPTADIDRMIEEIEDGRS